MTGCRGLTSFAPPRQEPGRWCAPFRRRPFERSCVSTLAGGNLLVEEIGWSQKHFINRFRDELGLAPKTLGRVLRFARAIEVIKGGRAVGFAALAAECGYYDQAHFARDVRQFAGVSPRELVRSASPAGGFLASDLDG